jgi:hypothetical protein
MNDLIQSVQARLLSVPRSGGKKALRSQVTRAIPNWET